MKCFIDLWRGMYGDFYDELGLRGLNVELFEVEGLTLGSEVRVKGIDGNVALLASLDYLGLGNWDPLKKIAAENILSFGTGLASSRSMFDSSEHIRMERNLADFKDSSGAILLNTGYAASSGAAKIIFFETAALGKRLQKKPESLVIMDELTHASFQEVLLPTRRKTDGFVRTETYKHLEYDTLEEVLEANSDFPGQKFIVSDSLFSMNGTFVDTKVLLALAKKYECVIVLDGAHSDGVYGSSGRGILEMQGIDECDRKYFVEIGTLSKAFASLGGYIAMPKEICNLVPRCHWPYLFSVGLPTHSVATSCSTLEYAMGEEGRRRRETLCRNSALLRDELITREFDIMNSMSHIVPIAIGKESDCIAAQRILLEKRILVGAVRFPAVKKGHSLLRLSLTSLNTQSQIEKLIGELVSIRDRLKF